MFQTLLSRHIPRPHYLSFCPDLSVRRAQLETYELIVPFARRLALCAVCVVQIDSEEGDPIWTIGTVISNPQNSWSDGLSAGLEVVDIVCTGTSAFWETKDPTEEIQWACMCELELNPETSFAETLTFSGRYSRDMPLFRTAARTARSRN